MKITREILGQKIEIELTDEEIKEIKETPPIIPLTPFNLTVHEINAADFIVYGTDEADARKRFEKWWLDDDENMEYVNAELADGYCGADIANMSKATDEDVQSARTENIVY